jgi:hypothetical protein
VNSIFCDLLFDSFSLDWLLWFSNLKSARALKSSKQKDGRGEHL